MNDEFASGYAPAMSRRDLLSLIGAAAGSSAMYQAMISLGYAAESHYSGAIKLEGNPTATSVLILGAGLAGMVAALELRKAGYKVQVLEYQDRAGGRSWTLRGGDSYIELGGFKQICEFDKGLYINPGPWRIPYHHRALLDYCKRLNVALEPFIQINFNSYLHSNSAFDGKPQRYRHVMSDFYGHISELLAKATNQGKLDDAVTKEDKEILLEALKFWGSLDKDYAYKEGLIASYFGRGFDKEPGGGLDGAPVPSKPLARDDLLRSGLWRRLKNGLLYEFQHTMFQPVGGMDSIANAFQREIGSLIRFNTRVTEIKQSEKSVTVTYEDLSQGGTLSQVTADWCLCTIPLSVLSQIKMNVGSAMQAAIDAVPYAPAVKVGLQFKRRFWEEDDAIYGGVTYTDLPVRQISYPSTDFHKSGKGVMLGAYTFGTAAVEFTAMRPEDRVKATVGYGAQIHPQYKEEFENGIAVAWHRVPWTLGCYGMWTVDTRKQHYKGLCEIDGRIALAGEHASYLPAWQEGAILSSLDAISRLHKRVVGG
ncbi:MAG TPA: flavin monoamine oxidase family protein [Xanthobacteraceae bacterium]|jgi:monoamine oxidase|nr:flavin monoamine oxidase family protein [Xanthobacteraceae bacterium]